MRVHDDWATPAFDLRPVAVATGPFTGRELLRRWWEHRRPPGAELALVEGEGGLLPLHVADRVAAFLGEEDLFDYHSPLGEGVPELVASFADSQPAGTRLRFDSLPGDAADLVAKGLDHAGLAAEARQHEVSAVVALPGGFEDYLAGLDKKQRHEVRRKERRFERLLGSPRLVTDTSPAGLASFVALHRQSPGEKGEFMTPAMEAFFDSLLDVPGAKVDLLVPDSGPAVAAAVGFATEAGYFLYNSAYDPEHRDASPGVVLVSELIRRAVERGAARFDFLKGDEDYKFRLGAEARPLYLLEATT